ncbi:MAG: extracellular solute-binding protein [Azoarcus sp.]|jgi:sn-glycerol 3-phosphate transport system substrate-binding protein|nr:extracellular solute-binding protein [Azoarcus sp.]
MSTFIQGIGCRGMVCAIGAVMLATLAMPAAAQAKKAKAPAAAKAAKAKAAQPAGPLQIELSQNLPPSRSKALQDLVKRFNEQSQNAQVTLVESNWQAAKPPHMMILGGADEEAFLSGKTRYKPLHALMKEAGVALQTVKPAAMLTKKPVSARGQLLALPVALNTPVLYFNRAALKRAGVSTENPPVTTWSDLQGVLSKVAANGYGGCPLTMVEPGRVLIENNSAWNNVPVLSGKQPSFNGLFHVKYISLMASWARADLLKFFNDRAESEGRFIKGECAVFIGPSDSWAEFHPHHSTGFDVGVTRLPYVDDAPGAPQNTLADGASLWVAAGKKSVENKAVANFVKFWLQPENQVIWQRDAGYLPLNKAGIFASESTLLGDELENIKVAIKQLSNRPVTANSSVQPLIEREATRRVIDEELGAVWANHKSAKAALDSAVARLSSGKKK